MAEHEGKGQKTQSAVDQKQRVKQHESQPLLEKLQEWDTGAYSIVETPFEPRMDEHAELLSATRADEARSNLLIHLQQTYGNRYVQRLTESIAVQPKLAVNAPNDIYEQEADRVASVVTSAIGSQVQRQPEEEEEELQAKPILQRQPEEKEELLQGKPILQQQPEEEEEIQAKSLQRQAEEEPEEEEEEPVQTKAVLDTQRQNLPEEELQAQPAESQVATVSESLETRINNAWGSGHPLSDNVREPMEQAFGADFSDVRVHTDSEANELNRQLNARAFTTGQDIYFHEGGYSTGSDSSQKLIAHELTHVVQQAYGNRYAQRVIESIGSQPKPSINASDNITVQRKWSVAKVDKYLNEDEQGKNAITMLNSLGYEVLRVNKLSFFRQYYKDEERKIKVGKPVEKKIGGWQNPEKKQIAISDNRNSSEAASTFIHEAAHAQQHKLNEEARLAEQKQPFSELKARELDAHIKQAKFDLTMGRKPLHPSFVKIGKIDEKAIEEYVDKKYAVGSKKSYYREGVAEYNTIETIKPWPKKK